MMDGAGGRARGPWVSATLAAQPDGGTEQAGLNWGGGADVFTVSLYAGSGAAVQVRKESLHGDLAWAFGTVPI